MTVGHVVIVASRITSHVVPSSAIVHFIHESVFGTIKDIFEACPMLGLAVLLLLFALGYLESADADD